MFNKYLRQCQRKARVVCLFRFMKNNTSGVREWSNIFALSSALIQTLGHHSHSHTGERFEFYQALEITIGRDTWVLAESGFRACYSLGHTMTLMQQTNFDVYSADSPIWQQAVCNRKQPFYSVVHGGFTVTF